jgi:geranylgeranylglycerol-phosphate geranylgeranyltransferase
MERLVLLNPPSKSPFMKAKPAKSSAFGAYARLFRIEHAAMLAVAALLAEFLVSGALSIPLPALPLIIFSLAVPVFIEMGSFALNDYLDIETDRANKREDRPIASGEIKKEHALYAAVLCYVVGIAASFPLSQYALAITLIFALLSVAYDFKLKELPLVGNICIALSMAIPFLFGNFVLTGTVYLPTLAIGLVAMVAGLGREIIKSTEDMQGDVEHRDARTLPVVIGRKNAMLFAAVCYAALVPLSFVPFELGMKASIVSLGLISITAMAFLAMALSAVRDQGQENLIALRKSSLLTLAAGLLGYAASLI